MASGVAIAGGAHRVQFYDDTAYLADRVSGFLRDALESGGTALCVARSATSQAVEDELRVRGIAVDEHVAAGRLVFRDAQALLAELCTGPLPDRMRFFDQIGGQIARLRAASPGGPLHVYGEMVDVLWSADRPEAVLALEDLWTELSGVSSFVLLCGYRLGGFADERYVRHFEALCGVHDHVAPTERFADRGDRREPGRTIAKLEQRARTLENEIARRTAIEQRIDQLFVIAGELASATSREVIAQIAVDKAIAAVGASSGAMWIVSDESLHLLGIAERHVGVRERFQAIPLASDTPLAHAVRTGERLFLRADEYRRRFPESYRRVQDTMPWQRAMFAVLPLVTHGRPFGGITFSYLDADDSRDNRVFLETLARQCAVALERAMLVEAERAARQTAEAAAAAAELARSQAELLYELTSQVNRIDELGLLYDLALETVESGARCDRSAILLYDQDGVMRFKSSRGLSETYRRAVEGHSPWRRDDVDPEPVLVEDVMADPAWASYREVFRAEGIGAIAFVPVLHHGKLLGKFMLYRDRPSPFTSREIQLATSTAIHVAQALERKRAESELARVLEEEKRARFEAEEATRAREEILSVVSHDLRNPLGTILMGASTISHLDAGEKTERLRTTANRIQRQAERMARLIEDLVDFSGIQAGRLKIEPRQHEPKEILLAASEIFGPVAHERGLVLETSARPDLPTVVCDSERALQVLSNLLSNAIKVTPKGGAIAIGAERNGDDEIVFFVKDSGPGIDEDELPNLFERYWRSKKQTYKGAGLGLSIARGIVDAHGGRIWAESQVGSGSTFYFSFAGAGARRN